MAVTSYGVGDALAAKRMAKILASEALVATDIARLMGDSAGSIIHIKNEPKNEGGDQVTFGLRMQLTGDGVTENETLEGNEESLTTYSDAVLINELDHAVRVEGEDSIDQQRVLFNLRDEARSGLADWYADRLSLTTFVQLGGYTASTMTYRGRTVTLSSKYRGLNTVTGPSTNRRIYATGTPDQAVGADTTAVFNLNLIDAAKERAMTANPKIRPVRVQNQDLYVVYLHPYQTYDLRTSTSDGQWFDIQRAAIMGGDSSKSPIFTGALGLYNGVVLRENEDVTTGVHSTAATQEADCRRALFLGAQSGAVAFSSKFSKNNPFKWIEKKFDYDRELGVSVQSLLGMKKLIFNSEDFGVITISTYAASH